jgi:hypothetical protein
MVMLTPLLLPDAAGGAGWDIEIAFGVWNRNLHSVALTQWIEWAA